MKCQNCNHTVTKKSKFCPNCGEKIVFRSSQNPSQSGTKIPFVYVIGLVLLGGIIGFGIFKLNSNSTSVNTQTRDVSNFQNLAAIQSAAVLDIAKEFMCPCGDCNDPLDVCNCDDKNGAIEVKSFIAQKLQEGHQKPHIMEMVQAKYGGLKKESKPVFKFDPSSNSNP